ncbi:hypothetical protein [Actinoplanes subglobosus]|uniref:Uncharacterized protein n=1 Tax=Actinoplanes subglobosus TaxID=1547892 RepID=A0ABV8IVZ5_9ACTN
MGGDSAVSMFVRLVDRSVEQLAWIAADGRRFDRQEVARIADVWDNNTFNFFGMLGVRNRWLRERAARAGLRWMGEFGPERRDWLVASGGDRMRRLLVPVVQRPLYYRDYQNLVRGGVLSWADSGVEGDYDLSRATVRVVRVERSGDGYSAWVRVRAPRRFADGDGDLHLEMPVRRARFDSGDAVGIAWLGGVPIQGTGDALPPDRESIRVGALRSEEGLRIGAAGALRGGEVTVWFEDSLWHLSGAARAIEAEVPPWRKRSGRREPVVPGPAGSAWDAARAFHQLMIQIRRVRYDRHVGQVPVERMLERLAAAGTRAFEASRMRGEAREQAFQRLSDTWAEVADNPKAGDRVPAGACVTLVSCSPGDAEVTVNFAVPEDGRWPVRAAVLDRPDGVLLTCENDVLQVSGRVGSRDLPGTADR